MVDPVAQVQTLLSGMPAQRPQLSVLADEVGRQIVVGDRAVVLFGPWLLAQRGEGMPPVAEPGEAA